jgi:hypothetical protein
MTCISQSSHAALNIETFNASDEVRRSDETRSDVR